MSLLPLERWVREVEVRNLSDLLRDFRKQVEQDAETPIERLDVNASLLLGDLCVFLGLSPKLQEKVLGKSAARFVVQELGTRTTSPTVN